MTRSLTETRAYKHFGGFTKYFRHDSELCQSKMNFAVFLPPGAGVRKVPVLYWLSGLTCTEEIFMTEAQAQAHAVNQDVILVVPDTSPRNTGIPGEDDSETWGSGASFYVDATQAKWSQHYKMYSYITQELRILVESNFPIDPERRGIFGHSMGGHGALVLGLRNPNLYRSISALAPICLPSKSPWGRRAFKEYLGEQSKEWMQYDANELLKKTDSRTPILIDQGSSDEYLLEHLHTNEFENSIRNLDYPATVRLQGGYDHSYYFVSTFIKDHIEFHAAVLNK